MENKSIVTPYMTEYHERAHKHMKKLIALEDRIAKYKRANEAKESVEAFYDTVNDLTLVTEMRRSCSMAVETKISGLQLQDMNRMWKQYK
jgi:hypothetical protein